jgi:hypothetical protein
MVGPFHVSEGKEVKEPFPKAGQSVVVAIAKALLDNPQGIRVRRVGLGRAGKQTSGELVQNNHEGQAPAWRIEPVLQVT